MGIIGSHVDFTSGGAQTSSKTAVGSGTLLLICAIGRSLRARHLRFAGVKGISHQ